MSLFGSSQSSGGGLFGSTTPAFGANTGGGLFNSSTPAAAGSSLFGKPASTPASGGGLFGSSTSAAAGGGMFGSATPASQPSLFGSSTPAMGGGLFGASTPATGGNLFGASAPATGGGGLFGGGTSLFQTGQQQQQQPSLFGSATPGGGSIFGTPAQLTMPGGGQLTTQMAPAASLTTNLADREVQAIVEAYDDNANNPKYRFRHLFLSVTDPANRFRHPAVSDLAWAEALSRIASTEPEYHDKLWPELAQGFKDLSKRLKVQDDVMREDSERLRATEAAVRQLQRHFEAGTVLWIQRLRQKKQELQRRLLKVMRMVEALEGRAHPGRPLTRGEGQLAERLQSLAQQLESPSADLPRCVNSLLSTSRVSSWGAAGGLGGTPKVDQRSLAEVQEVLRQETEAIKRLAAVLKQDARDAEIISRDGGESGLAGSAVMGRSPGGVHLGTRTTGRLVQ